MLKTKIRTLRLDAGMNKAELARAVGVSNVNILYWETGAIKQIGHKRLMKLAEVFGITVSELLDDPMLKSKVG